MSNWASRSYRYRNGVAIVLALCTSSLAATAYAQAPVDAAQQDNQLGDIVVTAQKRSENLQTVPISVSAFTGKELQARQVTSVFDLVHYSPDVQYSTSATASASGGSFYIRGIGQFSAHTTAEPAVGIYVDGVYQARFTGSNIDLGDIADVEILKGPQGTLFGRNSITGAVSITTNRPTFEFVGSGELSVGSIDAVTGRATLNVPLVDDKIALRVSVLGKKVSSYGTDIGPTGTVYPLGDSHTFAGRAQILVQATEDFDVLFSGDVTHTRGHSIPGGLTNFTPSASSDAFNATSPIQIGPQDLVQGYTSHLYLVPRDDLDAQGASMTMTWKPGTVTVKSITAYRHQIADTTQDYGGVPAPYIAQALHQTQHQFSQELQGTGALLNDRLKYTGGVYFFSENAYNGTYAGLMGRDLLIPVSNTVKSYSAYGQATYDLTDKLSVTGGLRWTHERKSIDVTSSLGGVVLLPQSNAHVTFHATTPMGNIKYQWTSGLMTYVSVARGFRSGSYNAQPTSTTDLIPTKPEKATTYEAGVKFETPDKRLRLNVATFYNDYTDIQLGATTDEDGVFLYRIANAAKGKIYGGEVELNAVPVSGLEVFLNGSYLHSKLSAVAGFDFGTSRLPSAPKFIVNGGASYGFGFAGAGKMTVGADVSYRTSAYPEFDPAPASRQDAYALVNARILFEPTDSPFSFSIWGKNLTNKKYEVFGQTAGSDDVTVGWFGRPREYGATAALRF